MRDPDGYYVEFYFSDSLEGSPNETSEVHETATEKSRDAILEEFSKSKLEQGQLVSSKNVN